MRCEADPSLPSPSVEEEGGAGGEPNGEGADEQEDLATRLASPECSFVNVEALPDLDLDKFMGTWYHLFRYADAGCVVKEDGLGLI